MPSFMPSGKLNITSHNIRSLIYYKILGDSMITLPTSVFNMSGERFPYFLTWYNTSALLPLSPPQNYSSPNSSNYSYEYVVDSEVLGLSIPDIKVKNTSQPIVLQFSSMRAISGMVRIINMLNSNIKEVLFVL